jgi:hypothetical protein
MVGTTTAASRLTVASEMSLVTDNNNRAILGWDNTLKRLSFGTINASTTYFDSMSLRDGNLLVGTTTAAPGAANNTLGASVGNGGANGGYLSASRDQNVALYLNRKSTDGDTALFCREGSQVGSISVSTTGVTLTGTNGITFTATQTASANANTLDDYEEGTFTATLRGSTSDPTTPVTTTGYYTKVGNIVSISIQFNNFSNLGAAGEVSATGLPYTVASTSSDVGSVMCFTFDFNSLTSVCCYVGASTANIYPFMSGNNAGWSGLLHNAGTARYLWMSCTYRVS